MKIVLFFLISAVLIISGFFAFNYFVNNESRTPSPERRTSSPSDRAPEEAITTLAENLDTPWSLALLPTGGILVTERPGTVRLIDASGTLHDEPIATIASVREVGEGGLLGIALDPDFETNNYVYLYYTYSSTGNATLNRVVRMTLRNNQLSAERVILDRIPGASNHNGGRIIFGPDGYLYIGTGDAEEPSEAQNTRSLAGKILRITRDGKPVDDNPFNNEVYSYGHRNVQGLAFTDSGELWATEHGRSGITSGLDEINKIERGRNYGWPEIQGDETRSGMVTPKRHSGPTKTWAPSGTSFIGSSLFFGGLRGITLYEAVIMDNTVTEVKEHFHNEFGRIRDVVAGPDGLLYITTSNRDGRGRPGATDDRVIRINPESLR